MKNIKSNIAKLFLSAVLLAGFTSCEDKGYEDFDQTVEARPAQALSGEWYIDVIEDGVVKSAHAIHHTYDSNDGKLTIDDHENGWFMKGNMNYNVDNLTFSVTDEKNQLDAGTFTVTEGKIMKNAARSLTGNVTDSIYFKATFSYDPENVIEFSGHRKTGFIDDEY